ncbi:MAG: hypothetical protein SPF89_08490 [Sphaerochaetaceae bacterium]|nr:hypothetical protein [Spirochaetales bacterium]MDY5500127.1 hypothetical protein [Sphaerochaetaceae bacterium]
MRILFGGYSQISAGTPHSVYERVLESVLKPILTLIYHSSDACFSLALSGAEMEWLDTSHPEVNMLVRDLVKKGRVNMIGGTYWQGILSLLAPKDRNAQIEKATTEIRRTYGERTNSCFCYGQVFAPYLLNTLSLCDMDRILIGPCSGSCSMGSEEPFVMYELDKRMVILPISSMASALTKKYAQQSISFAVYLKEMETLIRQDEDKELICFLNLDQLSEGGIQPEETVELCKLFFALHPLSIDAFDGTKRVGYQCDGWYGDDCQHFGAPCFNTLFQRDENMGQLYGRYVVFNEIAKNYKRNREVKKQIEKYATKAGTGSPYIMDAAASMLRQETRQYFSRQICEAENLLSREIDFQFPEVFDYNRDGIDEYRCSSRNLKCLFSPRGGSVAEISYLLTGNNFSMAGLPLRDCGKVNSLFAHGEGIRMPLMTDVFLKDGQAPDSLNLGPDFYGDLSRRMYIVDESQGAKGEYGFSIKYGNLLVDKRFRLKQNTLIAEISLTHIGKEEPAKGCYGLSCPITVLPEQEHVSITVNEEPARRYRASSDTETVVERVHSSRVVGAMTATLFCPKAYTLVKERVSIRTRTILGEEDITLFHLLVPLWSFNLEPGESVTYNLGFRIEKNS